MNDSGISVSYLTLRRLIGFVSLLHPAILFFGGLWLFKMGLQPSMSDYYYTGMRDVFVGIDFATGVFFLCYRGYSREDRVAAVIAGVSAIVVALFPTPPQVGATSTEMLYGLIHAIGAFSFLAALAYFSLVLFVRHEKNVTPTKQKLRRNIFYRVSGFNILAMMVLILCYVFFPSVKNIIPNQQALFWMEVSAFVSFGFAWLIKGETLMVDEA